MPRTRRIVKATMPADELEHPSKKKGSGGKQQKRKLEKERNAQAVPKKKQQRTEFAEAATSVSTKVVRVTPNQRAEWQPLSKSTREHLESMMHWLIISILYETPKNHSEVEKHLNLLKNRLLHHFENLRVPVQKVRSQKKKPNIAAEKEKSLMLEEGLAELENEIDRALSASEFRDKRIQSLQNKVLNLRFKLKAMQAKADKFFQRAVDGNLALPDIPVGHLKAPILQNELLKIGNQQGLLHDLNTIQQSDEMKTMLSFLEKAYENVVFRIK
ncbi:centromere protein Q isoform X1 [Varanus komodoensis]|uniref:centromere protein Q isoform X1 n=1 Tax=Varanus komodoensis TaxID=61221 RepID=UPI001CF7A929|nr:centromere protein Q isoform X1 [Varanus komodoensis]